MTSDYERGRSDERAAVVAWLRAQERFERELEQGFNSETVKANCDIAATTYRRIAAVLSRGLHVGGSVPIVGSSLRGNGTNMAPESTENR